MSSRVDLSPKDSNDTVDNTGDEKARRVKQFLEELEDDKLDRDNLYGRRSIPWSKPPVTTAKLESSTTLSSNSVAKFAIAESSLKVGRDPDLSELPYVITDEGDIVTSDEPTPGSLVLNATQQEQLLRDDHPYQG